MTALTVHNVDDAIKGQLEINAIQHNCSVEEGVCRILKQALFHQKNKTTRRQVAQMQLCEMRG